MWVYTICGYHKFFLTDLHKYANLRGGTINHHLQQGRYPKEEKHVFFSLTATESAREKIPNNPEMYHFVIFRNISQSA